MFRQRKGIRAVIPLATVCHGACPLHAASDSFNHARMTQKVGVWSARMRLFAVPRLTTCTKGAPLKAAYHLNHAPVHDAYILPCRERVKENRINFNPSPLLTFHANALD